MKYHNITTDDMLNGDGLRVVLWTSGCIHHCEGCHNPITWNAEDGIEFDDAAKAEIFDELAKDYISGITFSGGDPLHSNNIDTISALADEIRTKFPGKTIWIYSGYEYDFLVEQAATDNEMKKRKELVEKCNVFVDGKFVKDLKDENYHWAGSTNQRVIRF